MYKAHTLVVVNVLRVCDYGSYFGGGECIEYVTMAHTLVVVDQHLQQKLVVEKLAE